MNRFMRRLVVGTGLGSMLVASAIFGSMVSSSVAAQTPATARPMTTPSVTVTMPSQNHTNVDVQSPHYSGTITIAQNSKSSHENEQAEAAALQPLAKITAEQAKNAALNQFPGAVVTKVELDNENGVLVYSVHLTNASGTRHDVKVDAGSGKVLGIEGQDTGDHEKGTVTGQANED